MEVSILVQVLIFTISCSCCFAGSTPLTVLLAGKNSGVTKVLENEKSGPNTLISSRGDVSLNVHNNDIILTHENNFKSYKTSDGPVTNLANVKTRDWLQHACVDWKAKDMFYIKRYQIFKLNFETDFSPEVIMSHRYRIKELSYDPLRRQVYFIDSASWIFSWNLNTRSSSELSRKAFISTATSVSFDIKDNKLYVVGRTCVTPSQQMTLFRMDHDGSNSTILFQGTELVSAGGVKLDVYDGVIVWQVYDDVTLQSTVYTCETTPSCRQTLKVLTKIQDYLSDLKIFNTTRQPYYTAPPEKVQQDKTDMPPVMVAIEGSGLWKISGNPAEPVRADCPDTFTTFDYLYENNLLIAADNNQLYKYRYNFQDMRCSKGTAIGNDRTYAVNRFTIDRLNKEAVFLNNYHMMSVQLENDTTDVSSSFMGGKYKNIVDIDQDPIERELFFIEGSKDSVYRFPMHITLKPIKLLLKIDPFRGSWRELRSFTSLFVSVEEKKLYVIALNGVLVRSDYESSKTEKLLEATGDELEKATNLNVYKNTIFWISHPNDGRSHVYRCQLMQTGSNTKCVDLTIIYTSSHEKRITDMKIFESRKIKLENSSETCEHKIDLEKNCKPILTRARGIVYKRDGKRVSPCDLRPGTVAENDCKNHLLNKYQMELPDKWSLTCVSNDQNEAEWNGLPIFKCNAGCGVINDADVTKRMHYGTKVIPGEIPWQVAVFAWKNQKWDFQCGGSLIKPNVVLTAAHCIKDYYSYGVLLGSIDINLNNLGKDSKFVQVNRTLAHKFYNLDNYENDLALIRLDEEVPYTKFIRPVCVDWNSIFIKNESMETQVSGWGLTEKNVISQVLLKGKLNSLSLEKCRQLKYKVPLDKICAPENQGTQADTGDSGGPMTVKISDQNIVIGVVSFGFLDNNTVTAFTDLSHHMDWLKDAVRNITL